MNWRPLAEGGKWRSIRLRDLSEAERRDLYEYLTKVVPKREFGSGVDTYTDYVRSVDVQISTDLAGAAELLAALKIEFEPKQPDVSLEDALIAVTEPVLAEVGLSNDPDGFVYWSPKFKKWRSVKLGAGKKFNKKFNDLWSSGLSAQEIDERDNVYTSGKPWRRCISIDMWRHLYVDEFSALATAINIIHNLSAIGMVKRTLEQSGWEPEDSAMAIEVVFFLGVEYERLHWKLEHEPAAIKGHNHFAQQSRRSRLGGDANRERAHQARRVFDAFALKTVKEWIVKNDRERIRWLRSNIENCDTPEVFYRNGKLLSRNWFENRLSELQQTGRIEDALENNKP